MWQTRGIVYKERLVSFTSFRSGSIKLSISEANSLEVVVKGQSSIFTFTGRMLQGRSGGVKAKGYQESFELYYET